MHYECWHLCREMCLISGIDDFGLQLWSNWHVTNETFIRYVLLFLVTVKQDRKQTFHFLGRGSHQMFLFHKIFVLPSLRFCLFFSFTFCNLSLLCVVHCNISICLSLSLTHTHTPNHAHMSTHAFTDKTFSWRVNTREKKKNDVQ